MFLQVVKDVRTNKYKSHRMVSREKMLELHPFSGDLKCWSQGARKDSRFGLSNNYGRFVYVKTDQNDPKKLEELARAL
jgi:hypothetical protein